MKKTLTLALSMLAATVAGTAFAETQLLYGNSGDQANVWTAAQIGAPEGWSLQITSNDTKNIASSSDKITVDGVAYKSIKLSNGQQNTVTLPEGYIANSVTIYATANLAEADLEANNQNYWKEVDGVTYTLEDAAYNVAKTGGANPAVHTFPLSGDKNSFTFTNSGKQPLVILVVDYTKPTVTPVDPSEGFGEAALAAPAIYPGNNSSMLLLNGVVTLTFAEEVQVNGKATFNDKECTLVANGNEVYVEYEGLQPSTAYTLTIPAGTIGNTTSRCEDLVYNFTTRMADVLYYADFNYYPEGYYNTYTAKFSGSSNIDIIAKNKTATVECGGMTFHGEGSNGRIVAMNGSNILSSSTEGDDGASARCIQMIDGAKKLYVEFPEMQGPIDVTFYIGNVAGATGEFYLTDENADLENPLYTFKFEDKNKTIHKYTYTYPYKGSVKLRLYNNGVKINVNDALFVKGEGEGIDKPVYQDETAPALLYQWPASNYQPYAPLEGNITLIYDEDIVAAQKAVVNGVETEITVDGKTAKIAYSGLENGKTYTAQIPAIADEAGNETAPFEITFTTEADNVIYYTDYNYFPYAYWDDYHMYPQDGVDNGDILAKNSTDKDAEVAGILYHVGATAGRVVAMGKSNLLDGDNLGATPRCAQISGGGNDLYLQLPETTGPCELTLWVGNSTAKEFSIELRDALTDEVLTTFSTQAVKEMYKFNYVYEKESAVQFRLYNLGNQFNLHDILLVKGNGTPTGIEAIEAAATDAPVVYYNLQGQRVANPAAGLYIRVQGTDVKKVIL